MSWTDRRATAGRWFRRIDTRLGLTLAGFYGPLVAIVLFALYALTASELLELTYLEVDERLSQLELALQDSAPDQRAVRLDLLGQQLARDAGGFVVRDASGVTKLRGGASFPEGHRESDRTRLFDAVWISRSDFLRGSRRLADGGTLDIHIGSAGFVEERDEILYGFWIALALGVVLVGAVTLPATHRALAPLRRATWIAEAIGPEELGRRLPDRGAGDDVDRHSEAVNRLLDRIEAGFTRIRTFSQDVAHELRTPVNRILNVSEVALLGPDAARSDRSELQSIHDSAGHMARIIENLLLLARSDDGRLELPGESIDIPTLCRTLREIYTPVCEDRGIAFEFSPGRERTVIGDSALLLRAIANLIDNALGQTPRGGCIRITAGDDEAAPGWLQIEVSDTGPGIRPEDRERIFDRFVSLRDARHDSGTGLGLAITRALARAHGGDAVLGMSNGAGSCFVIRLPVAHANAAS